MLFNSWEFLIFFVAVYAAYALLRGRAQNILLLLASYFFYGWWDVRFLGLLLASTVVDYLVAKRVHACPADPADPAFVRRRRWLLVSLATNLGILGFFKYFNFFVGSAAALLESVGLGVSLPVLEIVLPVGISFYTFQTMAYTIDVYRGKLEPERDPIIFGLYVCYFPQLVAGPIERADRLLPQLRAGRTVDAQALYSGMHLIFLGLVRKVGIADVVAPRVDKAFRDYESLSGTNLLLAVLMFALQIYGDFSGYSAIARGTSRLLGIELIENFQQPYFATHITAFWRRWHMSLSSWLRDYLYISLGGNRHGTLKTYRNLMLTMLLGGLWHGAAWTFVVWGAIHGVALAVHRLVRGDKRMDDGRISGLRELQPRHVLGWATTMSIVIVAWVFFRAPDFGVAWTVLTKMFTGGKANGLWIGLTVGLWLWVLVIDIPLARRRDQLALMRWPWPVLGLFYAVCTLLMVILKRGEDAAFIYFQF